MARDGPANAFRRMAAVQVDDVRGHRAIKGIPYVPRDSEPEVERSLQQRRLLIVGPAMAGKTRLALQLTRDIFPDHGFVEPRDGEQLRAMLDAERAESSLVIWLDDLERFLGTDAVTKDALDVLHARGDVVVATIDDATYDDLTSDAPVRPAATGVASWFDAPVRLGDWSEREFARAANRGVAEKILASARRFGLSACAGGGPVLVRRFRAASTTEPVGYAMARAAADWRRTGTSAPLTMEILVEVLPAYLEWPLLAVGSDAIATGLAWATTPIDGVALVEVTETGLEGLAYLRDHIRTEGSPIPSPLLEAASRIAATSQNVRPAPVAAPTPAAEEGSAATSDPPQTVEMPRFGRVHLAPAVPTRQSSTDPRRDGPSTQSMRLLGPLPPVGGRRWDRGSGDLKLRGLTGPSGDRSRHRGWDLSADSDIDLGNIRARRGDVEGAADAYQRAIDSGHPDHSAAAQVQFGNLLKETGNQVGAAAAYQRAIDSKHPDHAARAAALLKSLDNSAVDNPTAERDAKAALDLGMQRLKQRDLEGAMQAWQRALSSSHPEHAPAAALRMASVYSHRGDSASAVTAYRVAIESGHPEHSPEAALGLGNLLLTQGDRRSAAAAYQVAVDSGHPTHAATAGEKLAPLSENNQHDEQAAVYQRTIEAGDPDEAPRAALMLAMHCQSRDDIEGEAAAYQAAISFKHRELLPLAAYNLGVLRQEAGEIEQAAAAWELAISSGDSTYGPLAAFNLGILRREQDDVEAAAAALRIAVSSGDHEYAPAAALELGELHKERGELEASSVYWQKILEYGHPEYSPPAALNLGILRWDGSDADGAVAAWQYAIDSRHPESAPAAALHLGHLRRAQGDLHRAAANYQLAIDSGHEHAAPEASVSLGLLLEEHGDPTAAAAAYQVAVDTADPLHSVDATTYLQNLGKGVSNIVGESNGAETAPDLTHPSTDAHVLQSPEHDRIHSIPSVQRSDPLDQLTVEEVFSRAFLRVYDRACLDESDDYSYARPVAGDLVELLVVDHRDSVQILTRPQLERLDWSALHSAALAHLLAEPIDDYSVFDHNGGSIHVAYGRSIYIASKLLILPDVLGRTVATPEPPNGVLVAVPNNHEIAFHPIVDRSVVPSLRQLSEFAAHAYSDEEGSVSPLVFWWQQGSLRQLTRYDAGGHIVLAVDDAFQDVLKGLIGSA